MTRKNRLLIGSRTEIGQQIFVHEANSSVQQRAVAGRAIVRNRALNHVAQVVHFMPPSLDLGRHAIFRVVSHVVGVQIAVGFLHRDNFLDDLVRHRAQLRTIAGLQRKARRLCPLVNVGVRVDRSMLRSIALANKPQEIIHPAIRFQQFLHGRNAFVDVGLAARSPKSLRDRHRVYRNVMELGVRRLINKKNAFLFPGRIGGVRIALPG